MAASMRLTPSETSDIRPLDAPSSDFDFLVEFDTPVTLFTESGLERELEEELNVTVELSQPLELRAFVRAAALKDALLV